MEDEGTDQGPQCRTEERRQDVRHADPACISRVPYVGQGAGGDGQDAGTSRAGQEPEHDEDGEVVGGCGYGVEDDEHGEVGPIDRATTV